MLPTFAAKSLFVSDRALTIAFVTLFGASVTYLGFALDRPTFGGGGHTMTLVSANADHAIVGSDTGLRRVTIGSVLPGFGQIVKIEWMNSHWSLVFSTGKVLTMERSTEAASMSAG